jgi:hypothetical protein
LSTVTIPAAVKVRIDTRLAAAKINEGKIFRPVNKGHRATGKFIADEKAIWQVVIHYARATSLGKSRPYDLRRTCAKLCRKSGGELEQIQLLLAHASVQTTENVWEQSRTSRSRLMTCWGWTSIEKLGCFIRIMKLTVESKRSRREPSCPTLTGLLRTQEHWSIAELKPPSWTLRQDLEHGRLHGQPEPPPG